jgi:hypothetical protein
LVLYISMYCEIYPTFIDNLLTFNFIFLASRKLFLFSWLSAQFRTEGKKFQAAYGYLYLPFWCLTLKNMAKTVFKSSKNRPNVIFSSI